MELSRKDKFIAKKIRNIVALQISYIEKAIAAAKDKGINNFSYFHVDLRNFVTKI